MSNVVCLLNVESDRATFTWSEGPASFEPYKLEGMIYKDFQESAAVAREKLANLVKDYMDSPQTMPQSAFELAGAGNALYLAMFRPGAEQARQAKQVRQWLEQLAREHVVDTLEIVVESPWSLPWNIVYDRAPDEAAFLANDDTPDRWQPFWGLRYNLAGGRKVDPLRRMPLLKEPKVLLVVDPNVRDGLPAEQQKRLADFTAKHNFPIAHSKNELQAAIAAQRPDLLYWLSHAHTDALELAGDEISPRGLHKLLRQDDDEHFGGLAFLNACQTAEGGAGVAFFEALHNVGFAGMIGTEQQTVDTFAHPLGLDFLEAFLERGEPVGPALRKLRGRVPLGLLYGTYCPPDIRVDQGSREESMGQAHVQGLGLAAGPASHAKSTDRLPQLPDEPYRSLAYYDRADRALLAGRDDDIERFATMLDDATTRILVLHGESGVGKSSFLRAGVIPFLEDECLGYRFLHDRNAATADGARGSVIFIRATNDLFGQLAQALCEFCAQPYQYETPLDQIVSADLPAVLHEYVGEEVNQYTVRAVLRSEPALLGRIMGAIGNCLPFTAILIIDQGEEVFTLAQTPEDQQIGRQALDMLRLTIGVSGDFKVIFCLRTEYYGRCIDRLRRVLHDTGRIREYLLTDFDEDDLAEAIGRPTADKPIRFASEVPFEKYGFRFAPGMVAEIARRVVRYTTQRRDSVLPLMQVTCSQLNRMARARPDRTITLADLERLGGIEGGMHNHVEALLGELLKGRPLDKRPVQKLFTQLYLKQLDGTLTTALLAEEEVRQRWTGRMPFSELLEACCELRLLKVNTLRIGMAEERRYVSLGHDALAKQAAHWDEELIRSDRVRRTLKKIAVWTAAAIVILSTSGSILGWMLAEQKALSLVREIKLAPPKELQKIIDDELPPYRLWANSQLRKDFEEATNAVAKLHVALALVPVDAALDEYLQGRLLDCSVEEFPVVRNALMPRDNQMLRANQTPRANQIGERLWAVAADAGTPIAHRFHAACALATFAPEDERWNALSLPASEYLVGLPNAELVGYREALRPARKPLQQPLAKIFAGSAKETQVRQIAAETLADFAADNGALLAEVMLEADPKAFEVLLKAVAKQPVAAIARFEQELYEKLKPIWNDRPLVLDEAHDTLARRQANAAVALLRLGSADHAWQVLKHSADPQARSYLIHSLSPMGADPQTIMRRFDEEDDATVRRALLLALGEFSEERLPQSGRSPFIPKLQMQFDIDPDSGLHAAAEWLLRKWGQAEAIHASVGKLRAREPEIRARQATDQRQWYVNSQGQTFVILEADEFLMGSPDSEPDRISNEHQHRRRIGRKLAIAAKELTREEYQRFLDDEDNQDVRRFNIDQFSRSDDSPQIGLGWYDSARYCNWLSKTEGIPEDQWCYVPNEDGKFAEGMRPAAEFLKRTGYRLPTEAEWEFACRAGAATSRYYGSSLALLPNYAWFLDNSPGHYARKTGLLKPNDFGLFDVLGNAFEFCHDSYATKYPVADPDDVIDDGCDEKAVNENSFRVLRGASFFNLSTLVRSAFRVSDRPGYQFNYLGFRPARTYR